MLLDQPVDHEQVFLCTVPLGAHGVHAQQAGLAVRLQPDVHRGEVAHHLVGGLVKEHVKGPLTALAGRLKESTAEGRLGGAWGTADQRAAATKIATAKHAVQPSDAGGDALGVYGVAGPGRSQGSDVDA